MIFTPLFTVGKPKSYPLASGQTVYRGQVVFAGTTGELKGANPTAGDYIAGIADDFGGSVDSLYKKVIKEINNAYSFTSAATPADVTFTINTGLLTKVVASTNFPNDADYTGGWALYLNGTKVTSGASSYAVDSSGTITITIDAADQAASTDYTVKIVAILEVNTNPKGGFEVQDMFNNDTTKASNLVTTWFLEGEYKSDMYDPYDSYQIGDPLYATTTGLFAVSTTNAVTDGANAIQVGIVIDPPSASLTAETRVTDGHENPNPEALTLYWKLPMVNIG